MKLEKIVKEQPIEIKYKAKVIDKDLIGIREFMRKFSVKRGTILTKDHDTVINVAEGTVKLEPVWKFLLRKSYFGAAKGISPFTKEDEMK
ncbi:MAG: hypothetical protein V1870_05045 [Candidatus Aenigmatarchaeota archaeon]